MIATPLYDKKTTGDTAVYFFGKSGGEDTMNTLYAAEIKVYYSDDSTPSIKRVRIHDRLKIGVPKKKISTLRGNTSNNAMKSSDEEYIRINTKGSNKAIIFIDQELRRGNALVCIFNATTGNLLAILDPKKQNQSFITKDDVFVFPLIRPFVTSKADYVFITFQVGDPKVNGSVTASEE